MPSRSRIGKGLPNAYFLSNAVTMEPAVPRIRGCRRHRARQGHQLYCFGLVGIWLLIADGGDVSGARELLSPIAESVPEHRTGLDFQEVLQLLSRCRANEQGEFRYGCRQNVGLQPLGSSGVTMARSKQYLHSGCSSSWASSPILAQRAVEHHLSHFVGWPRGAETDRAIYSRTAMCWSPSISSRYRIWAEGSGAHHRAAGAGQRPGHALSCRRRSRGDRGTDRVTLAPDRLAVPWVATRSHLRARAI